MNSDTENYADENQEIEIEASAIEVLSQPIELYKLLKVANLVSGGGEAKYAIAEGYVAVNGELETRKRRKMYDGDFFEFNQEFYVVILNENSSTEANSSFESELIESENTEVQHSPKQPEKRKPENKGKSQGRRNLDFLG